MKKIAIIGAGYSALALAWELSQLSTQENPLAISIIDQESRAGGMIAGFKEKHWAWTVEDHYHHVFASDQAFADFLEKLGLKERLFYSKTLSRTLVNGQAHRLDSALSLLQFKELSLWDRLRTGAVLALLKLIPNGRFLEKYSARDFLTKTMGQKAWQVVWEPLFLSKFALATAQINLAWFWARVKPRTPALGYVEGGFQDLTERIVKKLKAAKVKFLLNTKVTKIQKIAVSEVDKTSYQLSLSQKAGTKNTTSTFDLVISTLPAPLLRQISDLPEAQAAELQGLAAMTLVLRLKDQLLQDGTYWLNINEKNWPFVAVIEHDNLIDSANYNQESVVYLGRYLPANAADYRLSAKQLYRQYLPYLRHLNPQIEELLIDYRVAKTPFGQPLIGLNHSQHLPPMRTSYPNFYWVSMQHIYPFDRGVNHAVLSAQNLLKLIKIDLGL